MKHSFGDDTGWTDDSGNDLVLCNCPDDRKNREELEAKQEALLEAATNEKKRASSMYVYGLLVGLTAGFLMGVGFLELYHPQKHMGHVSVAGFYEGAIIFARPDGSRVATSFQGPQDSFPAGGTYSDIVYTDESATYRRFVSATPTYEIGEWMPLMQDGKEMPFRFHGEKPLTVNCLYYDPDKHILEPNWDHGPCRDKFYEHMRSLGFKVTVSPYIGNYKFTPDDRTKMNQQWIIDQGSSR